MRACCVLRDMSYMIRAACYILRAMCCVLRAACCAVCYVFCAMCCEMCATCCVLFKFGDLKERSLVRVLYRPFVYCVLRTAYQENSFTIILPMLSGKITMLSAHACTLRPFQKNIKSECLPKLFKNSYYLFA